MSSFILKNNGLLSISSFILKNNGLLSMSSFILTSICCWVHEKTENNSSFAFYTISLE